MHDRYLLLRRFHDLSLEDRFLLDTWTQNYPLLGQAHRLKEQYLQDSVVAIHQALPSAEQLENLTRGIEQLVQDVQSGKFRKGITDQ